MANAEKMLIEYFKEKADTVVNSETLLLEELQPKFSPDGNALIFVGYSNPDAYGIARQNFGIVKFIGLEYTYMLSSKREQNINVLTYINKDWLYVSAFDNALGNQRRCIGGFAAWRLAFHHRHGDPIAG